MRASQLSGFYLCAFTFYLRIFIVIYYEVVTRYYIITITLSLALNEEHRLRVFENRVVFGPKRDEVTGDWRKLHSEELHNMYSSPNTMRMMKSRRMR
jgi:hypothetical protein